MENEVQATEEVVEVEEVVETPVNSFEDDYNALKLEYDKVVESLPKEPTEDEKAFKQREKDLFDKEVSLTLRENKFEQYASLINVSNTEELMAAITVLQEIHKQEKVNNSYVPSGSSSESDYEKAQANKDINGMIGNKLSRLFGNR